MTQSSSKLLQPSATGDLVGLVLENASGRAITAAPVSFGQVFKAGSVMDGNALVLRVDGKVLPVQMDVKTHHADGSVAMAVLSFQEPVLPTGASLSGMLAVSSSVAAKVPALDLGGALRNYSLYTDLAVRNADGSTTTHHVDLAAAMKTALAQGTASFWMQGSTATQARVDVGVLGSLHVVADITAYGDGTIRATIGFNNDLAMGATGGKVTYAAKVVENGQVVASQAETTQFQYQNWHLSLHEASVNLQHDVAYLQAAGAIPDFDFSGGVSGGYRSWIQDSMNASNWDAPFAPNGIAQYMPNTGGRGDIGVTTQANWAWLATQDAQTAKYALGQANAASGIPWHFKDVATGTWLSTDEHPQIWTDGRGGYSWGTTGLTQNVDGNNNGWVPDTAHQPNLSAVPYILTGNRTYLDDLNAQASNSVVSAWPGPRNNDADLLLLNNQVRGFAWSMREIGQAAALNPDGSVEKAYFDSVADANWSWLVKQLPKWTAQQGEVYGHLVNAYPDPTYYGSRLSPWQEDFVTIEAAQAALAGNADARTFLEWRANWAVGRFLHEADGFNPHDGVNYTVVMRDSSGGLLTTWKAVGEAMVSSGVTNGTGWWQSNGYYAQVAAAAVAGIVTVTHSMDAERAYAWLISSGAPFVNAGTDNQFDIAPRLADGTLLTSDKLVISTATADTTLNGTAASDFIQAGSGNDVVLGLDGNDLLFGGSGYDRLFGGAGNDDLFGGTGGAMLMGGVGTNRLDGGSGADTFVFRVNDDAQDTVTHFKVGVDSLRLVNDAGVDIAARQAQTILSGATQDAAGNVVLHLSAQHDVTIVGVSKSSLSIARGATIDLSVENGNTPVKTTIPNLTGTSGNDSLGTFAKGEAQRMVGGFGDDFYFVDSLKDVIVEAKDGGQDTVNVSIAGGTYQMAAYVENLVLAGTTAGAIGNELNNVMVAGTDPGVQTIMGGAGDDTLIAGLGRDVLGGGAGADLFIFTAGLGGGRVMDFTPGVDRLMIGGAKFYNFNGMKAASKEIDGSTVIDIGRGQTIELTDVKLAALHASDFVW